MFEILTYKINFFTNDSIVHLYGTNSDICKYAQRLILVTYELAYVRDGCEEDNRELTFINTTIILFFS